MKTCVDDVLVERTCFGKQKPCVEEWVVFQHIKDKGGGFPTYQGHGFHSLDVLLGRVFCSFVIHHH